MYTVTFDADGTIDRNLSNLDVTNQLLAPIILAIELATNTSTLDFWQLLNWYCVTAYWTLLYQFGDIAPTMYGQNSLRFANTPYTILDGEIFLNGLGSPNF